MDVSVTTVNQRRNPFIISFIFLIFLDGRFNAESYFRVKYKLIMIHHLVQIESHGHLHIFQTAILSQEECQSTDSNFRDCKNVRETYFRINKAIKLGKFQIVLDNSLLFAFFTVVISLLKLYT